MLLATRRLERGGKDGARQGLEDRIGQGRIGGKDMARKDWRIGRDV